jgi:hypothetical protein
MHLLPHAHTCSTGDEGCEEPSPRERCLIWSADGTMCLEPECQIAHDEEELESRRGGMMWATLKKQFGGECGFLSPCRVR